MQSHFRKILPLQKQVSFRRGLKQYSMFLYGALLLTYSTVFQPFIVFTLCTHKSDGAHRSRYVTELATEDMAGLRGQVWRE